MTPEQISELQYKIADIIDAAVYGGLDIGPAVADMFQLFEEELAKAKLEWENNKTED